MKNRSHKKASALVTTLFVVVVLSTIVMAFMASMSLERKIASSMKNKFQAELAAEAGMQDFLSRLENIKTDGPYSTVYVLGQNTNPYLFLGKRIFSSNGTITKRVPLFSTGFTNFNDLTNFSAPFLSSTAIVIEDIDRSGTAISRTLTSSNDIWCDINKTNAQFPSGLVGLRNTFTNTNSIPLLSANWVYVKNSKGKVIGRYAYWADDECSKIDIRYAGQAANTSGNHTRSNGSIFSELALTPLTNTPSSTANLTAGNLANLLAFTNNSIQALPLSPQHAQYPIAAFGNLTTAQWQSIKPFVTIYSRHDDRSLDGKRRVNLNALVTSTTDAAQIADQTLTIRDAIINNLPKFGERFYSAANGTATTPTADHQKAYTTRIAANIRDFIDTDNQATIIQADGTAYAGNNPLFANLGAPKDMDDEMLPLAFGKEKGLYVSEYLKIIRVIDPSVPPVDTNSAVDVRFRFAHYIELANISQKTISYNDLGEKPFILISGRSKVPLMNTANATPLRISDLKINLPENLSVPPRQFIYLTTDGPPWAGNQTAFLGDPSKRFIVAHSNNDEPGTWKLINTTGNSQLAGTLAGYSEIYEDYQTTTKVADTDEKKYAVIIDAATETTYTDQTESIILANNSGIIDCAFRIYTNIRRSLCYGDKNPLWFSTYLNDPESSTDKAAPNGDTSARYTRGDLRSNMEIGSMLKNTTALGWKNAEVRYGGDLESNTNVTLGTINYEYDKLPTYVGNFPRTWRKGWYEYTSDLAGNHFVKNTNLTSLAELGYIYDPARYDIEGYRSMGATLRIGQSDSATNNRARSAAADYQNWLGGRGNDSATNAAYGKNAFLLMDVFRTDTNTAGRINPNSAVRDGFGTVMRSALTNFVYESEATNGASSLLGSQTLNPTNTIAAVRSFATNSANGFLISVGDLSRIPAFWGNGTSSTNIVPTVAMSAASDAGKEEFLRRTANLLTTQSLAYTVYIVGQTGEILTKSGTDTFVPASTTITESVIQLEPVYPSTGSETPVAPTEWKTLKPRALSY
jgi:hypothetical protein